MWLSQLKTNRFKIMKKLKTKEGVFIPLKKMLLIVKLIIFLMILGLLQVSAESYSQTAKLRIKMNNVYIVEVFSEIERISQFRFFYDSDLVDLSQKVSIDAESKLITDILDEIFLATDLNYEVMDRFILIKSPDSKQMLSVRKRFMQQQRSVSGNVTDTGGQPLPGVSIIIKGTTTGTVTDANGEFTLSIPGDAETLQFSFVGMRTQEIPVAGRTTFNVVMEEETIGIEEVVAVGYGTMRKSDLTGAVASVSEDELQSRPVTTFEDALKGRTSGVQIRQTGGDLTGRFSISIRGIGSVTGSSDPLIVVDGVPLYSSNLSMINPKDIESIDILKDASATAIYGARAANGVIMVTTKKGEEGKMQLTVDADIGFEEITKKYDLLTTEQQRQLFVEAFKNSNRSTAVYDDPSHPAWQIDTDWQDLATRTALRQNYNLGFSGGNEKTNYSGSASYLNREGTIKNTDYQLWSVRLNINSQVNNWLKYSTNFSGSHRKQNVMAGVDNWQGGFRRLSEVHSYTEPYDEDGNLTAVNTTAAPYFGSNDNPLIELLLPTRENDASRILGNAKVDATLIEGLVLSANLGSDILTGNGYTYLPVYYIGRYSRPEGSVTNSSNQQINWVGDLTLNYDKKFVNHEIKLLGGISAQQFIAKSHSANGTGTIDNSLNQLSNQTNFNASGSDVTAGLSSYFLRGNYNYSNKYLVTATLRRDGSSKFGPENRYGFFPSGSVAWRITEENFFQGNDVIDDLKLRASYGLTGNQDIGNFAFITRAGSAPYVFGNSVQVGNAPQNMGNPRLKWEATAQLDIGMDISLFDGRIYSSLDYYNKHSQDLLITQPVPITAGVTQNPTVNIGSVENKGFELSLNTINLTGAVSWNTNFNISFNKNEVIDIGSNSLGEPLEIPGIQINLSWIPVNLTKAGHPVGAFYTYTYTGVWQLGEEEEAAKWSNAVPGDPKYADLNNNGILDEGDRSFIGNPHPKFFGGLDNTFSYKRFSLSVFAEFAGGYQLFNSARNLMARGVPFLQQFAECADFWTPDNPSTTVPRPSQGGNTTTLATLASSRWLEDADYLRIKNIKLSYDIPASLYGDKVIQSARLTLTGTNLITFTKYSGLDPESSSRTSLLSAGIDHTPYPQVRLVSMALQLSF
jgi:TonB-dependent starch-binding outer membrane protein SusC